MATGTPVPSMPTGDGQIHVYRVSFANKVVSMLIGALSLWGAGWVGAGLFVSHLRTRIAQQGCSTATVLTITLTLFGLALFFVIRPFQMRLRITSSQVEVPGAFSSQTIPFSDIRGRRNGGGTGGRGTYLYRRGKSRVLVRESILQLDDFYNRWSDSIYDLDKADRLRRRADGKERLTDWFALDNDEQRPTIGGPDGPQA